MTNSQMEAIVRSTLRGMGYTTDKAMELAGRIAATAPRDPVYMEAQDKVDALEAFTKFYVQNAA